MLIRPSRRELRTIGYHLGQVANGLSLLMALPALVAVATREWHALGPLLVGAATALLLGQVATWRLTGAGGLDRAQGTIVVALAWLLGSMVVAIPYHLSGHTGGFVDAWFESMSGLTTSGLSVLQDLDHLGYAMGFFRHLTHFAGGQGIVIVVLAVLAGGGGGSTLYLSEGRDERVVPNVVRTARVIFAIALTYLVVGTAAVAAAVRLAGVEGARVWHHSLNLFFAAFDTGGFAPTSQSVAYYHSATVELVLAVLMVAGALSFALHHQLWLGRYQQLTSDVEVRSLLVTLGVFTLVVFVGLARAGTYDDPSGLVRKGFFTVLSAHTGTGFGVTDGTLFLSDWGALAPAAIVVVMALGAMAGSTAGGFKAIRVVIAVKAVVHDLRRTLLPDAAVTVTSYHSGRRRILRDDTVRGATTLLMLYAVTYLAGAAVALSYGRWDVTEAIFESVSAAANVGLSVGIVDPGMPLVLKITIILQMWAGRLEFIAVFALLGYAVAMVRGRR